MVREGIVCAMWCIYTCVSLGLFSFLFLLLNFTFKINVGFQIAITYVAFKWLGGYYMYRVQRSAVYLFFCLKSIFNSSLPAILRVLSFTCNPKMKI